MTHEPSNNSNYDKQLDEKLLALGPIAKRVNRKVESIEEASEVTGNILNLEFTI
jgi:hypothetical protein